MKPVFFLSFLLFFSAAEAQPFFQKTYGDQYQNIGFSMCRKTNGTYAMVGFSMYNPNPDDISLAAMDSAGTLFWAKRYGGSNYDYGHTVQATSDGGFIMG